MFGVNLMWKLSLIESVFLAWQLPGGEKGGLSGVCGEPKRPSLGCCVWPLVPSLALFHHSLLPSYNELSSLLHQVLKFPLS